MTTKKIKYTIQQDDIPPRLCGFLQQVNLCTGKNICNCLGVVEMLNHRGYYDEAQKLIKLKQNALGYCY